MTEQYIETVRSLRGDPSVHYNCAQSVLITFSEKCGITQEQAASIGAHFGGGMKMGSLCGAITGGTMVIGMLGGGDEKYRDFLQAMKEVSGGAVNCRELLANADGAGCGRKVYCDGLICEAVENIARIMDLQETNQ